MTRKKNAQGHSAHRPSIPAACRLQHRGVVLSTLYPITGADHRRHRRPTERSDRMTDVSEVLEWHGRTVVATDGDQLGKIEEIYFDQETNRPEWALIDTGMFAGKSSFMPLQGATSDDGQVTAPYSKDQVKDAPKIKPTRTLSQPEEAELYRHYGVDYGESRSGSGLPEDSPTDGNGQAGITAGQGRLKKHLVSERVTGVMPSERDRVVIEPEATATDETPDRR